MSVVATLGDDHDLLETESFLDEINHTEHSLEIEDVGMGIIDTSAIYDDYKVIDNELHGLSGVQYQFYWFLKRIGYEEYFNIFRNKDLCDIRNVEYLTNDEEY